MVDTDMYPEPLIRLKDPFPQMLGGPPDNAL